MIQQAFHNRTGRIVASGRALLANFFLGAVLLDPMHPDGTATEAYIFLGWYAILSIAYLVATWNDWWLDRRLCGPAHAVDLIAFSFLVSLTENASNPFFAFSVFIVLSATMRWSWREATLTAVLISLLFVITALFAAERVPETGLGPFIIPGAHLVVLSVIIIWFGMNQPGSRSRVPRLTNPNLEADNERPPIRRILEFASAVFPGARIVLAWWEADEPWTNVATFSQSAITKVQLGPKEIPFLMDPKMDEVPALFDLPRNRMLVSIAGDKRLASQPSILNEEFARRFGIERGLRIPVRSDRFEGEVFVLRDLRLSADDLEIAERVGFEISGEFGRSALFLATEEAAATRERLSFARDLHDSVVQFLAGISMQMEGVRKSARSGEDIDPLIDDLQRDLQTEQRELRSFIIALRGGRGPSQLSDLSQHLRSLVQRLTRQWDVDCRFQTSPSAIQVPADLRQDIDLLVREGLANAVRHGGARILSVDARLRGGKLELVITDNGKGFPDHGDFSEDDLKKRGLGPWSLRERIHKMKGSLHVHSSESGARLTITLPIMEQQT